MEIKTISGKTINNATIHYYPNDICIIKAIVNCRHDSKILCRFVMKDLDAVKAYFDRNGWTGLKTKIYVHKGV